MKLSGIDVFLRYDVFSKITNKIISDFNENFEANIISDPKEYELRFITPLFPYIICDHFLSLERDKNRSCFMFTDIKIKGNDLLKDNFIHNIKNFDKYIYPIKLSADLENLTGLHAGLLGSQAVGQPFWKKLSFDVLKDLRNRKALLLLDYTMECFFKPKHHESLQVVLRQAKIPFESVMLLINGVNSAENYHEMFLHNKPLHQKKYYKIRDIAFTLEHSSYHYSYGLEKNVNTCLTTDKFLESKSIIME